MTPALFTPNTSSDPGVNNNDHIFICDNPCNGNWRQIDGGLKQIDAGDMEGWGVSSTDNIYKRPVNGSGTWTHIGGKLNMYQLLAMVGSGASTLLIKFSSVRNLAVEAGFILMVY